MPACAVLRAQLPAHLAASGAPCRAGRSLRPRLACPRASPGSSEEFEGVPAGEPGVQDALLAQLRAQLETQAFKEELREDLEGKVEEVKAICEDLLSQLDEEAAIEKFRTELESGRVLEDANEQFNQLEEQLQAIKDQIKADQAELRSFEASSAAARSAGLFFRSLYQPESAEPEGEAQAGAGAGASPAAQGGSRARGQLAHSLAARRAAAAVAATAEGEVGSPFRMYLFACMAAVLALVVAQDVSTGAPSLGLDGLYAVLGLLLGVNAHNERQVLLQLLHKRRAELADAEADAEAGGAKARATAAGSDGPDRA